MLQQKVDELQDRIDRGHIAATPAEGTAADHTTAGASGKEVPSGVEGDSSLTKTQKISTGTLSVNTPLGK